MKQKEVGSEPVESVDPIEPTEPARRRSAPKAKKPRVQLKRRRKAKSTQSAVMDLVREELAYAAESPLDPSAPELQDYRTKSISSRRIGSPKLANKATAMDRRYSLNQKIIIIVLVNAVQIKDKNTAASNKKNVQIKKAMYSQKAVV